MTDTLNQTTDFLLYLDQLKAVQRRTYVNAGARLENSAEHSWHVAMACWAFAELLEDDFDVLKLIKMALIHDVGEIGAGDTFLYSSQRSQAHIAERESIAKTAAQPGNPIGDLAELWEEQETGNSKEAKLLRVIDRLLPFLHNLSSQGYSWQQNNICRAQVESMHGFIKQDYPEIYAWFSARLDECVAKGWLRP